MSCIQWCSRSELLLKAKPMTYVIFEFPKVSQQLLKTCSRIRRRLQAGNDSARRPNGTYGTKRNVRAEMASSKLNEMRDLREMFFTSFLRTSISDEASG